MDTDFKEEKRKSGIRSICELTLEYGVSVVTFAIGCCILIFSWPIGVSGGRRVFTALLLMFVGLGVKTWLYMRNHRSLNPKRSIHIITEKQYEDWLNLIRECIRTTDKI